jgi:hypothetical protein
MSFYRQITQRLDEICQNDKNRKWGYDSLRFISSMFIYTLLECQESDGQIFLAAIVHTSIMLL